MNCADGHPPCGTEYGDGVAIIGMSCIFPGAGTLDDFWRNIQGGIDCTREPGADEWHAPFYRSKSSFGRIYCSRGGFISEFAEFNPIEYGIMPSSVHGGDPDQFLCLKVAAAALRDAGYEHKNFEADRAEVVIGRTSAPGAGSMNLIQHGQTVDQVLEIISSIYPWITANELVTLSRRLHQGLQPCNADTIPGVMPNIIAGRVASKLGLRGRSFVLDAACASSLIAVEIATQNLLSGNSDFAIAGGVHINSHPYFYQMFCELGALSSSGMIRPFDDSADGTILGEGAGIIVLKRAADAIRDGNRIYAIIRGIGSSSDGRAGGNLSPNVEGEALAMQRAYDMSGISPRTVELLEAHGTGTRAGDVAEMRAVEQVFQERGASSPWCALGSVKSMIGHTQAASGIAGLIKAALSLYHRTLPPTLHIEKPNSQINWQRSPCYLNTRKRPWDDDNSKRDFPRRAAVSAFGFGGVNAHVILEECHQFQQAQTVPHQISSNRDIKLELSYPALTKTCLQGFELAAIPPCKSRSPATEAM